MVYIYNKFKYLEEYKLDVKDQNCVITVNIADVRKGMWTYDMKNKEGLTNSFAFENRLNKG